MLQRLALALIMALLDVLHVLLIVAFTVTTAIKIAWFRFLLWLPSGPLWWDRLWERIAVMTTPKDGY